MSGVLHTGGGGFFRSAVARPVALTVSLLTLIVLGSIAYTRIPLQMLPNGWNEPSLSVWITNPGSTPRENEEKVARIVEEQLRTLSGIERVRSTSREDSVSFRIDFAADVDMEQAKAEVRDRVERARPALPETADRINIWSEDGSSLPLAWFGILHSGDTERTDYLLDRIVRPKLEAVPGVGKLDMWGSAQDSVRILLDEDATRAANIDLGPLIARLSSDNFALPLGEVRDGGERVLLRSDMRFQDVEEIADYPVKQGVRLGDLGRVIKAKSLRDWVSKIDGEYSYFGWIQKDSQANVVDASRALDIALEELNADPRLEGQLSFVPFGSQGEFIEAAMGQMRQTALLGGLFAVIVLFLFLRRLRLTLCVMLSIPVSILLALGFEYFRGGTLDVLSMTGLTLAIGMLVDNSVVVVENISRLVAAGEKPRRAAAEGTREIALAVTLATMTTVVVLMPLIFMSENPVLRVAFGALGIPLCVSLCFSLLVALVFLPVAAARAVGPRPKRLEAAASRLSFLSRLPATLVGFVVGLVRVAAHSAALAAFGVTRGFLFVFGWWPLRLALVLLVGWLVWNAAGVQSSSLALDSRLTPFLAGGEDAPPPEVAGWLAALTVGLPAALLAWFGLGAWRRRSRSAPRRPATWIPGGESLIDMVGQVQGRVMAWSLSNRFYASGTALLIFSSLFWVSGQVKTAAFEDEENNAAVEFDIDFTADFTLSEAAVEFEIYEEFVESRKERYAFDHWRMFFSDRGGELAFYWDDVKTPVEMKAILDEIKAELPVVPGHQPRWYDEEQVQARSSRVAVFTLRGTDSDELERLGQRAAKLLAETPGLGLSDVRTPQEENPEQLRVSFDRDLAQTLGVQPDTALNTIAWALRGWPLPRFHDEGREIPLIIEFDEERAAGISTLRDLAIFTGSGTVPLSTFADIELAPSSRRVWRENGKTTYRVRAEVEGDAQIEDVQQRAQAFLASNIELPRGYSWGDEDSASRRRDDEFAQLGNALMLSIVLVFLLMGILFESVLLPFSVLFTIPFAFLGSYWVLFLTGTTLDTIGFIGMIILVGVVVNNGIVLVDRIHQLVTSGMDRREAVLLGCKQRVRPVLMTAMTTVFGLMPMVFSEPATNSFDYRALSICLAGGLASSTFFTLWVVPLAYTLLGDLHTSFSSWLGWWRTLGRARRRPAPAREGLEPA